MMQAEDIVRYFVFMARRAIPLHLQSFLSTCQYQRICARQLTKSCIKRHCQRLTLNPLTPQVTKWQPCY